MPTRPEETAAAEPAPEVPVADDDPVYDQYEAFMGRWSRQVAVQFLDWLEVKDGLDWLDVGCGAGMLGQAIIKQCAPSSVTGVDPLETSISHAKRHPDNDGVVFQVVDAAQHLRGAP